MRSVRTLLLIATMALAGCASGSKLSELESKIPKLSPDRGRVYFYREGMAGFGSAMQSDIKLNGQTVGRCVENGVFFADLPPGDYHASVQTDLERTLNFTLERGEEKFVRCHLEFTFISVGRTTVELVDPGKARAAMRDLAYIGAKLD